MTPEALVASYPEPFALMNAALQRCKAKPTLLACYVYLQNVYTDAKGEQGKYLPQTLAPTASFLGRYRDAAHWDPFKHVSHDLPANLPLSEGYHAVAAIEKLAKLAKHRRLVMINEWHLDASTRYLTLALLPKLYKDGFRYLAVEGLFEDGKDFSHRGYAVAGTGYYTQEPIYAALLARAVKLGYMLVRYDISSSTQQGREDAQAEAIYKATFAVDPDARVLVHAGVDHIDEKVGDFGPHVQPMAMRLHAISGINPLTVDQTILRSQLAGQGSHLYQMLVKTYTPTLPTILVDAQGKPWSARPGMTDVSVLAPEWHPTDQRPTWLSLGGLRKPVPISTLDCRGTLPCTVSARPVGEPDIAVPADRYAFLHTDRNTVLYVEPSRRYRIDATDVEGHHLSTRVVSLPISTP
jgi:hypothetical protein